MTLKNVEFDTHDAITNIWVLGNQPVSMLDIWKSINITNLQIFQWHRTIAQYSYACNMLLPEVVDVEQELEGVGGILNA